MNPIKKVKILNMVAGQRYPSNHIIRGAKSLEIKTTVKL